MIDRDSALGREDTRRELERRWTGEAYEATMVGHVAKRPAFIP